MTIEWLQPQVDSIMHTSVMIGGKEEKKLLDNHKNMIDRLDSMKTELNKRIRDYGYMYNSYINTGVLICSTYMVTLQTSKSQKRFVQCIMTFINCSYIKDKRIEEKILKMIKLFLIFFQNVMYKLGGTKTLFNDNGLMVTLMSELQAAFNEAQSDHFNYTTFRRAILDSHGYIKADV